MAYDFIDSVGNDVDVVSDSEVCITFYVLSFKLLHCINLILRYCHGFCHLCVLWEQVRSCSETQTDYLTFALSFKGVVIIE